MKIGITKGDMVMVVLAVAVIIWMVTGKSAKPMSAVIWVDGKVYADYALDTIEGEKTVLVETPWGYNEVVLWREGAMVKEADCPDKLDVLVGKLTHAGQSAICLPHRFMLVLQGGDGVDAISY